jgi:UDP-GlcNAc:undecaprenyl-phosphate GlcNAc-1-phosphate transferase
MRAALVAFALSTLCGAVLTPLIRVWAARRGMLDQALNSRKIHGRAIPRLGGIGIALSFYAPLAGLMLVESEVGRLFYADGWRVVGLFVGGLTIVGLGVWDDLLGTGALKKFAIQFGVAGLMYHLGFRIDQVANPFGPDLQLGVFGLPFTMLWIVGVINAMNLIDGLDGLAGGVAFIAVGASLAVAFQRGEPLMLLFSAALAGAILGFLFYNFNPASIFMGDSGSMFLGFVLATSAIRTHQKAATTVAILIPIVALGLPLLDTLLAIVRRAAAGRPLFRADREHIHHRLLARGLTHKQAVLILYGFCAILGTIAWGLTVTNSTETAGLLLVLAGVSYILLRRLGYMDWKRNQDLGDQRHRNKQLRRAVRELGERLRKTGEPVEVWDLVKAMAPVFGAECVGLSVVEHNPGGESTTTFYSMGFDDQGTIFRARFSLLGERIEDGVIELGWRDGRTQVDRDTEIALELLCDHVSAALERVLPRRAPKPKIVPLSKP